MSACDFCRRTRRRSLPARSLFGLFDRLCDECAELPHQVRPLAEDVVRDARRALAVENPAASPFIILRRSAEMALQQAREGEDEPLLWLVTAFLFQQAHKQAELALRNCNTRITKGDSVYCSSNVLFCVKTYAKINKREWRSSEREEVRLETQELRIRVPIEPQGQGRPRGFIIKSKFSGKVHLKMHDPAKSRGYKNVVLMYYRQACSARLLREPVYKGPVSVEILAVFECPPSKHRKRRPAPRSWHTKKPDLDNVVKALLDAGKGVLWEDDSQVCRSISEKVIAAQGEQPFAEILVKPLPPYAALPGEKPDDGEEPENPEAEEPTEDEAAEEAEAEAAMSRRA